MYEGHSRVIPNVRVGRNATSSVAHNQSIFDHLPHRRESSFSLRQHFFYPFDCNNNITNTEKFGFPKITIKLKDREANFH